jgi:SAM-dependent methyltransferase
VGAVRAARLGRAITRKELYAVGVRVIDLDRDMSDVIPTGCSVDSEFLFRRMEEATFRMVGGSERRRILDVAAGVGQDGRALLRQGAWAVGAEPSQRMTELARLAAREEGGDDVPFLWVRAWSEALPFRARVFDGAFCKGALDHFDDPVGCIAEAARVTKPDGRVVFAVANFESLGCQITRGLDWLAGLVWGRTVRGRRHYDVPSDHFTRYDPELLRAQLEPHVVIESWIGVSLLWGLPSWASLLKRLPGGVASVLLQTADSVARRVPRWADVIVVASRPRPLAGEAR